MVPVTPSGAVSDASSVHDLLFKQLPSGQTIMERFKDTPPGILLNAKLRDNYLALRHKGV